MTNAEWYVDMGKAVQERNRALSMVENWQEKVRAAEARIDALAEQARNEAPEDKVPAQEQEQISEQ